LQEYGFTVQVGIGGTGVVGVLSNGSGPTVLLRAELDALPPTEIGSRMRTRKRLITPLAAVVGVSWPTPLHAHAGEGADVGPMQDFIGPNGPGFSSPRNPFPLLRGNVAPPAPDQWTVTAASGRNDLRQLRTKAPPGT
jgi:hypothetical protein